jgi:hypothetical protein
VTKEIREEFKKFLDMWDPVNAMLRGKFIATSGYIF